MSFPDFGPMFVAGCRIIPTPPDIVDRKTAEGIDVKLVARQWRDDHQFLDAGWMSVRGSQRIDLPPEQFVPSWIVSFRLGERYLVLGYVRQAHPVRVRLDLAIAIA